MPLRTSLPASLSLYFDLSLFFISIPLSLSLPPTVLPTLSLNSLYSLCLRRSSHALTLPPTLLSSHLTGDIVCLQEVQLDHYEQHLNPFMRVRKNIANILVIKTRHWNLRYSPILHSFIYLFIYLSLLHTSVISSFFHRSHPQMFLVARIHFCNYLSNSTPSF